MADSKLKPQGIEIKEMGGLIAPFLSIPGLRGFWPMSSQDAGEAGSAAGAGNVYDLSGQGRDLIVNGNPIFSGGLDDTASPTTESADDIFAPTCRFDGSGDYLRYPDNAKLDLVEEITMGGWFYVTSQSAFQMLCGKAYAGDTAKQGYALFINSSNDWEARFGSASGNQTWSADASADFNAWHFVVLRSHGNGFKGDLIVDKVITQSTGNLGTGRATSEPFTVGASTITDTGTTYLFTGRASCVFVAASAINDETLDNLYEITKGYFGL